MKNKGRLAVLMVIAYVVLVCAIMLAERNNKGLIINEVIADNHSLYHDSNGEYHDLIEIFNPTEEDINLKDYGLTDDSDRPFKWQFPEITIKAGEYLLISASGNLETDGLYTNFKLDKSGEKVLLSDSSGKIISSVAYNGSMPDMSYGFNGEDYVYFLKGSPGIMNTGISIRNIGWYLNYQDLEPEVSVKGGIYDIPQSIEFKQYNNFEIRYTLDCSIPDKDSPLYEEKINIGYTGDLPILVSKIPTSYYWNPDVSNEMVNSGQVIRARYFYGDIPVGKVVTNTYFIWEEGNQRYDFDVVSLCSDVNNLFGGVDGIMVFGDEFLAMDHEEINNLTPANYNFRGRAWEREGNLEIFNDGEQYLSQNIGIRVAGELTRTLTKKSLRIIAREEYDDNKLSMDLFDVTYNDVDSEKSIDSLIIRTGGQDWDEVIFREVLTGSIMNSSLSASGYKPVILFVNGEYFGIYNLREDMNEDFVENHYNLDKDEFTMIEDAYDGIRSIDDNEEELDRYEDFFEYLKTADLKDEDNYEYVKSMMDIDNYIDYLTVNVFISNPDFYNNNIIIWRYTKEAEDGIRDGRYRYIIHDTDMSYNYYYKSHYKFDSFEYLETRDSYFFENLMTNDEFKTKFISNLTDSMNNNLSKDNVNEKIDYLENLYSGEIEENAVRWQITAYDENIVIDEWYGDKVSVVRKFIDERQGYLLAYLEEKYGLDSSEK